jgi:glycosyltransferase involved in cell wall biosynthesis
MILHAIPGLARAAGTSVYCAELATELVRQGAASAIAVPQPPGADACPTPAEVVVGPFAADGPPPTVVHLHGLWHPFLHRVASFARGRGVPVVISPQGMLTPWALGQKRLKKRLALAAYQGLDLRTAAVLHATADSEVDDIRRQGLRQPIVVAPFGIEIPVPPAPRQGDVRTAVFLSRIHPKKGLPQLVDAWARIARERSGGAGRPRWRLIIAGPDEGGHQAELCARAAAVGLTVAARPLPPQGLPEATADVIFTGPVYGDQKTDLYRQCDLFVLPTHSENFGVVILEALACGVPVITTRAAPWGGLEDVGRPGLPRARAGWWIDVGVDPLVTALGEALALSDAGRAALGDNGRWFARERYSWPAAALALRQTYDWLVRGGRPPDCVRFDGAAGRQGSLAT